MFGWPTGVGCLVARREALAKLERPWFSGGTIVAAFVQREYYQSAPGAAHFEDGTVNYLSLPQSRSACASSTASGSRRSMRGSAALGASLLDSLAALTHSDGCVTAGGHHNRTAVQMGSSPHAHAAFRRCEERS